MCSTKNLSWKKCNIISSRFCWIGWKHDINFLLKSYIPFFLLIGQTHCPSFKQEVGATCILSWIPLIFSQVPAYSASDWLASLAQPQWQKNHFFSYFPVDRRRQENTFMLFVSVLLIWSDLWLFFSQLPWWFALQGQFMSSWIDHESWFMNWFSSPFLKIIFTSSGFGEGILYFKVKGLRAKWSQKSLLLKSKSILKLSNLWFESTPLFHRMSVCLYLLCLCVCLCVWGRLMHRCAPCLTALLTRVFCLLTVLDHWSGPRHPPSPPPMFSLPVSSPSLSFVFLLFSQTFPSLLSLPLPLLTYSYSPPMSIIVTDTALDRLSPMSHDSPTVPLHQIYFCPLPACLYHHVLEEQGRN